MWSRTKQIFQKRPLLTNVLSFGAMYVGAEVTQQTILIRTTPDKTRTMDWGAVGRYAVIGLAGIGPALFCWYRVLDTVLPAATGAVVVKKVLADQLISSSSCIAIFFTGMGLLEGKEDIFAELRAKFWSTYKMSCCFWLPAQAINFALLPPYTRVAFVGAASFIWVNVLCIVKRRQLPQMSCCFWLPAQAINFALLPPYTRVAFVGAASFIWVNVLCIVKRRQLPQLSPEPTPEVLLSEEK